MSIPQKSANKFIAAAFAAAMVGVPASAYQGDAVTAKIRGGAPVSAIFDGNETALFPYAGEYRAVFGIPATKPPGAYVLRLNFADGASLEKKITVRAKNFPKVILGIPEKLGLTPSGLVNKLQSEKVNLDEIFGRRTDEIFFKEPFGLALADNRRVGSVFGEVRKTGEAEIRHLGTDFTAKKGAAVGAINAGVVRKAYFDNVYGNSVILDHGQGIFSFYIHLDKIKVKEGDVLKKGSLVGTVGATGYAETPHLHLSVKIGGVPVDPVGFVRNFK
jgi:murein DD-endopeptidase MepM/ murein hydrolase activator NlpD